MEEAVINMINIIIYSKNRALQLEACLRSLEKHFKEFALANIKVIYSATNSDFKAGYGKLMHQYTGGPIAFISQTAFRTDTLEAIDGTLPFTMFLVDDIIFKSDFSLNDSIFALLKNNNAMVAASLRLHRAATYCYALDANMTVPAFVRDVKGEYVVWRWPGCQGDWGYGFSLDGNVYNTSYIKELLHNLDFHNPNELEARLNAPRVGLTPIYMCCYDGISKLLNVPANRVQHVFNNRHELGKSVEELNAIFLSGKSISLKNVTGITNISVHYPIDYIYENY